MTKKTITLLAAILLLNSCIKQHTSLSARPVSTSSVKSTSTSSVIPNLISLERNERLEKIHYRKHQLSEKHKPSSQASLTEEEETLDSKGRSEYEKLLSVLASNKPPKGISQGHLDLAGHLFFNTPDECHSSLNKLANAMKNNDKVTVLHIDINEINNDQIQSFSEKITGNTTIKKIYASHNFIEASGAASLVKSLPQLETLDLTENPIDYQLEKSSLCEALKQHNSLRKVLLSAEIFNKKTIPVLHDIQRANKKIKFFVTPSNGPAEPWKKAEEPKESRKEHEQLNRSSTSSFGSMIQALWKRISR